MKVSHADEISSDSISPTAHSDADDTGDLAFNPNDDSDQDAAIAAMEACLCDIRSWMINDKLSSYRNIPSSEIPNFTPGALSLIHI